MRSGKIQEPGDLGSAKGHFAFGREAIPAEDRILHGQPGRQQCHAALVAELGAAKVQGPANVASEKPDLTISSETVVHEHSACHCHPGR
jgi:hypothetical protein